MDVTASYLSLHRAYLAHIDDEGELLLKLRRVIEKLIMTGELQDAGFRIGPGGGLGFRVGSIGNKPPFCQVDNAADLEGLLGEYLTQKLEECVAMSAEQPTPTP